MSTKSVNKSRNKLFSLVSIIVFISTLLAPIPTTVYAIAAPNPISPADGTVTTTDNYPPLGIPTVVWEAVPEATEYRLQFSSDPAFSTVALEIRTPLTTFTPTSMSTSLFADGDWYWKVRVEKPEVSEFSPVMHLVKKWATDGTNGEPDNRPELISPEPDAILDFYSSPVFSWTRVIGASQYRIQIASSPDGFSTPVYNTTTLAISHQPTTKLANGQYYWRVIPLDGSTHLGKESEVHGFQLLYGTSTMGQIPELYEPTNYSQMQFTPTFHWEAIPGAEKYQLEYMTDDGVCEYGSGTIIETRNTTYTPSTTYANDNYCWHVRVISGKSYGEWSETWHFRKQWDIQPILLTPTNNYEFGIYPLYSWTPVPGASYYHIEIAIDQNWAGPFDTNNTGNPFYTPRDYYGTVPNPYAWRVTAYDWNGHAGATSAVDSWQSYYTSTAPALIYPFYYYIPNDSNVYKGVVLNPYEDRTAQYPIFQWHRTDNPWPYGGTYAPAYRIEVSTSSTFSTIFWTLDTESTHAVPLADAGFQVGQNYYWRVCPLDMIGGSCKTVPDKGDTWWSQIWQARFDPSMGLPPTNGTAPVLLRPEHGDEWVEATPLLEWQALEGADYYQVQITRDPDFIDGIDEHEVYYPAYSSVISLAQRYLDRLDYGTFYWRVRANLSGSWSDWSEIHRFQIASQSEWRYDRAIGLAENRLKIGEDPDDADDEYELTTLYASNSNERWYFGFNATMTPGLDMVYGLYLDIDHIDGSGASAPPSDRVYNVSTIPAHEPEFAIYVEQIDGSVSTYNTFVYEYTNNAWQEPRRLSDIDAGELFFDTNYLELQLPNSAIRMEDATGSISAMLFSVDPAIMDMVDTVPSDPNVPGTGELSRFTSVSEHMNLYYPPNTRGGDPTAYPSVLPFLWDYPAGGDPTGLDPDPPSPWAGHNMNVCLDAACSTIVETASQEAIPHYFASNNLALLDDIYGDTTYYWRIQPRYFHVNEYFGAYNSGYSFMREGFVPQNLQTSVTFATPTFTWDLTEGAGSYDLQVSKGPDFGAGDLVINATGLTQNSHTPTSTLAEGEYWWRVRARRYGNFTSDWSSVGNFVLDLPQVTGMTPHDPTGQNVFEYAPTMCWDHMIAYDDGIPVLTAWRYKVEVSKDPNFSSIFDSVDTEQNCWTPTRAYDDGTYYWHVAMIDGNNRLSSYSSTAQFSKQYPITTLVSPIGAVESTPTFVWTPVDGAKTYYLQISQDPSFTPLYDNVETVNIQFTPTKIYDIDHIYYWRVAIRDHEGKYGPYNDAMIIVGDVYLTQLPLVTK